MPNELNKVGLYVAANPLTSDDYYFEIEIIDTGLIAAIGKLYQVHKKLECKNFEYFLIHQFKHFLGCPKEPSHQDGSFEYQQHIYLLRNMENNF